MKNVYIGLVVGGLFPALLWAMGDILQKLSNKSSPSIGVYLVSVGLGATLLGLVLVVFSTEKVFEWRGVLFAFCQGLCFAGGISLLALSIMKYGAAISTVVPLAAIPRVFFTVIFAFIVLGEHTDVQPLRLGVGVILLLSGALVVASAAR